jgi:hypothetical protein
LKKKHNTNIPKISFIILFTEILFLSGCINYNQEVHLYPDGSGKMKINYWMQIPPGSDSTIINTIGIFNKELINKEFSSEHAVIENIEVYIDSSDSTIHSIVNLNFSRIDSLSKMKVFENNKFSLIDGAAGQKIFTQYIPPIATGFGIDGSAFTVTYIYKFYGDIITHNAPIIDKQTLKWNYTLAEIGSGKTISVTFKPYKIKETPYWIYALSGLVLLIVIIFLFRKKKD